VIVVAKIGPFTLLDVDSTDEEFETAARVLGWVPDCERKRVVERGTNHQC
jgi:hypothetical protein